MAGGLVVRGGVLGGGGVAAADVPALGAAPQMEPPAAGRVALHAARRRWAARSGRCPLMSLSDVVMTSRLLGLSWSWASGGGQRQPDLEPGVARDGLDAAGCRGAC